MGAVVEMGDDVQIHETARINVTGRLVIGHNSIIGAGCVIEGRDVEIGNYLYMDEGAKIGGGSCFDRQSKLIAGHFLHMGQGSFINTARGVMLGNEVGLGMGTKLFTHGAYLSALDGFPVSFERIWIEDNVWLPGAIVNPGVKIGRNVVVGVNSLVNSDLPEGCLAGGSPAKVIKEQAYPKTLDAWEYGLFWRKFKEDYPDLVVASQIEFSGVEISYASTSFSLVSKKIFGPVTDQSEQLRNQLRRYGIRFYSRPKDGYYVSF